MKPLLGPPPRHFLDLDAISGEDLRAMLEEAKRRKNARIGQPKGAADFDRPLDGHVLLQIFEKNSTRTSVSFYMAMEQLGGSSLLLNAAGMQLGRGETVQDTGRVVSRMVDVIMIRANRHDDVLDLAGTSSVPVVNGLTNRSHPCQIMADLMTIEERLGDVKGRTIAWVGDGNNVCASFIHAAPKLGYAMRIATPAAYGARTQDIEAARKQGASIEVSNDAAKAAADADVVVTDCWVSMGDTDKDERMSALPPFQVNKTLMARAKSDALFLHCLPAHRGEEVTDEIMDGPASAVWDEAENRIHAQKAVLLWCLGKL